MSIFGHQPDGYIYIDTLPAIPIAFYEELHPGYGLPDGCVRREYMPGEYHRLTLADGTEQDGGPWPEGDVLLATAEDDAQAYLDSLPPPAPDEEPMTDEQRELAAIEAKRLAALRALDDQRLADAARKPDAPPAVLEYVQAVAAKG